jgi:cell division protein FtsB
MTTSKPTARDGFVRGNPQGNALARRSIFVFVGVGLVVLVALVQLGENGIFAFSNLRGRADDLQQEVAELEAQNLQMTQQLEDLAQDPEALEKLVREKHNMRQADEEVLVVLPVPESD